MLVQVKKWLLMLKWLMGNSNIFRIIKINKNHLPQVAKKKKINVAQKLRNIENRRNKPIRKKNKLKNYLRFNRRK